MISRTVIRFFEREEIGIAHILLALGFEKKGYCHGASLHTGAHKWVPAVSKGKMTECQDC